MFNISYIFWLQNYLNFFFWAKLLLTVFQAKPVDRPLKPRSTDSAWEKIFIFLLCYRSTDQNSGRPMLTCCGLGIFRSTDPVDRSYLQSSRLVSVDRTGRPIVGFLPKSAIYFHFSLSLSHFTQRPTNPIFSQNFRSLKSFNQIQIF